MKTTAAINTMEEEEEEEEEGVQIEHIENVEEIQFFTIRHFFSSWLNGWRILMSQLFKEFIPNLLNLKHINKQEQIRKEESREDLVPLVYGITILSKFCAVVWNWAPYLIFDIRIGVQPSLKFIQTTWTIGILASFLGVLSVQLIFDATIEESLPGLDEKLATFMSVLVIISQNFYVWHSLLCYGWILINRKFLRRFLLYDCAHITSTKKFQCQSMFFMFVSCYVFAFLAEPILTVFEMYQNFEQPRYFARMPRPQFIFVKSQLLLGLLIGTSMLSLLANLIAIITGYLVFVFARYLDRQLERQIERIRYNEPRNRKTNSKLLFLLKNDVESSIIMQDYSTNSFCEDWPRIDDLGESNELLSVNRVISANLHSPSFQCKTPSSTTKRSNGHTKNWFILGNRLYVFKNMLEILSDLKKLIQTWEKIFGSAGLILSCTNGLLVGQWVAMGLLRARSNTVGPNTPTSSSSSSSSSSALGDEARGNDIISLFSSMNWFFLRTIFLFLNFMAGNTVMFMQCDRLPSLMRKLRSQLFRMNIDLLNVCLEQTSSKRKAICCRELELNWILYDQLHRVSNRTNFKFAGNTYYCKNCLVDILSREVSLILLYIQILDIYTRV